MDKKKYVRVDPFTGFPEKDVKEDAPTTSTAGVAALLVMTQQLL